eukprot:g7333.t1
MGPAWRARARYYPPWTTGCTRYAVNLPSRTSCDAEGTIQDRLALMRAEMLRLRANLTEGAAGTAARELGERARDVQCAAKCGFVPPRLQALERSLCGEVVPRFASLALWCFLAFLAHGTVAVSATVLSKRLYQPRATSTIVVAGGRQLVTDISRADVLREFGIHRAGVRV